MQLQGYGETLEGQGQCLKAKVTRSLVWGQGHGGGCGHWDMVRPGLASGHLVATRQNGHPHRTSEEGTSAQEGLTVTPSPTQHLATFIMDKSEAITTVDDAIRKLVQLSSKEKIWTQEMLLQVDDRCLRLLDIESQVPCCMRWSGEGDPWRASLGLRVSGM